MMRLSLMVLCLAGCNEPFKTIIEDNPDIGSDTDPEAGTDGDGDGVVSGSDCDDGDASVGGPETWYADSDGDGYGDNASSQEACEAPDGHVSLAGDCDDGEPLANPGQQELCDGIDNDCEGDNEDGLATFFSDGGKITQDPGGLSAGTASEPVSVTLNEDGELLLCAGTWYANLNIQASVDITGVGSEAVVLNGARSGSVVSITEEGVEVTLSALRLEGGEGTVKDTTYSRTHGGGIYCGAADEPVALSATVLVSDAEISDNKADNGGGIYAASGCTVTLEGVSLQENSADFTGGALYTLDSLVISASAIEDNLSNAGGAGYAAYSSMSLDETTVSGNYSGDNGGGFYINYGSITVTDSTLSDNEAVNRGGFLYVYESDVDLTDTQVSSNISETQGGGIYLTNSTMEGSGVDFLLNDPDDVGTSSISETLGTNWSGSCSYSGCQ